MKNVARQGGGRRGKSDFRTAKWEPFASHRLFISIAQEIVLIHPELLFRMTIPRTEVLAEKWLKVD